MARVFIGVGHGGSDPGAVKYVKEAEANLNIALELKRILEEAGITVGISRTKDENDPLTEEIKEANAFKPDFAIDVHNNAGGGDGFEVLVQTGTHAAKSRAAGAAIEKHVKAMGQNSRGIKTKLNSSGKDYFGFLRQVKYPAVIVEGFFVDHKKDAADFDTVAEQKKLAQAYAKGIMEHLGVDEQKKEDKRFGVSITVNNLNIRQGPGVNYASNGFIKPGTYTIVEENDGWGKLLSGAGWIKLSYTETISGSTSSATAPTEQAKPKKIEPAHGFSRAYAKAWTVNASNLNMRVGAGTNKAVIKTLKRGERFTCYGYFNDVKGSPWLYGVDSKGTTGYCLKNYLK